jgi:hypothetical protein
MKRYIRLTLLGTLWLSLAGFHAAPAWAAPGGPDNSFQQRGTISAPIRAVAVDSHNNIWIGGRFLDVYGQGYPYLACLNPDGTLNTNFTDNSFIFSIGVVHAIAVDDLDNVFIAGQNGVGRLVANHGSGTLTWQHDATFLANASAVVRRGDSIAVVRGFGTTADRIFVAGLLYGYMGGSGAMVYNVARLNIDGTLDPGFSMPPGHEEDQVLQVRYLPPCFCGPVGSISFPLILMSGVTGVMVTMDNGELLSGLYSNGPYYSCAAMRNLAVSYNCGSSYGEIVAGGFFQASDTANSDYYNGFTLDRFGGSVTNWFQDIKTSHYPQDNGSGIAAVDTFEGGDIVIAGLFSQIHGVTRLNFAHLWADGSVDSAFTDSGDIVPFAMAEQPDGKFIIAGENTSSPFVGRIGRRFGLNPYSPVAFTSQPGNFTLYVGESMCIQPGLSGSPPPLSLQWFKDNNPLSDQTNIYLCFSGATTNDAGDYRLRANTFCGNPAYVDSLTAHLTVLAPPPPPPNDMFSNAFTLTGASAIGTSYIRSATVETGEPNHAGQSDGRSVWWKWTAPFNGPVRLDAAGSEFPAALGIYKGTAVNGLTLVTNGVATNLLFTVVSSTTYRIAVGGTPATGSIGNVVLRLNPVAIIPASLTVSNGLNFQSTGPDTGSAVVETTPSLNPANWQPFATNPLVNGMMNFNDPRPMTNAALFYRIRLQ